MHGGGGGGFSGGHGHGGGFGGHHHHSSNHHHDSNDGDYGSVGPTRGASAGRVWITAIGLIVVFGLIVLSGYLH